MPTKAGDTGDTCWVSRPERSLREGSGSPLPCSCLESPVDGEPVGSSPCGLNQRAWLKRLSVRAGGRGLGALAEPSVSFSLGWWWLHSLLGLGCSPSSLVGGRVQIPTVVGPMPEALGGCWLSPCAFWQRGRFFPEAKTKPDAFSLWPLDPTQDNLPFD